MVSGDAHQTTIERVPRCTDQEDSRDDSGDPAAGSQAPRRFLDHALVTRLKLECLRQGLSAELPVGSERDGIDDDPTSLRERSQHDVRHPARLGRAV